MATKYNLFRQIVLNYYRDHGRHTLPWRTTHSTPYAVLVSEIMLQQTQVDRVIPKFLAFLGRFPSVTDLASAPQSDVIRLWSGLGYNRRARFLHLAAQKIVNDFGGIVPSTLPELVSLPGLGPYTSAAILAFAYNRPVPVTETNIRTLLIHHFFSDQSSVSDAELLPLIQATIDTDNPKEWYAALMDYGSYLKATRGNLSRQSKTYTKQSKFVGSDRQLRGAILKSLTEKSPQNLLSLTKVLTEKYHADKAKINQVLMKLEKEKLTMISSKNVELI